MERREAQPAFDQAGARLAHGARAARSQGRAKGGLASPLAPPGAPFPFWGKEKGTPALPRAAKNRGGGALGLGRGVRGPEIGDRKNRACGGGSAAVVVGAGGGGE